ncbi:hypothetical protein [Achromobacter spanius]|uniref:hypothetical protein n=1 Tax=Achromobacter spanius TaxID=217203 RepID=UPI003F6940D1
MKVMVIGIRSIDDCGGARAPPPCAQGAQSSVEFKAGGCVASVPPSGQAPADGGATIGVCATAEPSLAWAVGDGVSLSASSSPPHPATNAHAIVAARAAFSADARAPKPKSRVREVFIVLSLTA